MCRKLFHMFAILAIFHSHQFTQVMGLGLTDLAKGLELITSLKYGDDCSWEAEQFRLNYIREQNSGSKPGDDAETTAKTTTFVETIIKRNYSLCSAPDLFICDKESQKCVCGDASYEARYKPKRSLHLLEDGNKCRWNLNTYCVLDEELNQQSDLIKYDSKCKTGTSCTTREGETCSATKRVQYILRNGGSSAFPTTQSFVEEMLAGKVCTCKKADPVQGKGKTDTANSKDDIMKKEGMDGNRVSGSGGRWKRHISENNMLDNLLTGYVGGVGPALFRVE